MSQEEEKWGVSPVEEPTEEESEKIGAERVMLKMVTSEGTEIEVNLLQVINQLFIDMGHFDGRVRTLEADREAGNTPIIKV